MGKMGKIDNIKILIVGSDEASAQHEISELKKNGYAVHMAETGESACQVLAEGLRVDLVLVNSHLSGGSDGTDAAASIHERQNLPIVFILTDSSEEMIRETEKVAAHGYVDKNSPGPVWNAVIKTALRFHQKKSGYADMEADQRFRLLLQSVPNVAVQGYEMDGTTVYWNLASETLYGYTTGEAIGKNLVELIIPPEMREFVSEEMRNMAETGVPIPSAELKLMHKDGSLVPVYSSHAIVREPGRSPVLFCIDIDLSERKQAEERVRHEMELRKLLVRLSTSFINIPIEEIEPEINRSLAELGNFTQADRAYIFEYDFARNTESNTHEWCRDGIEPQIDQLQQIPVSTHETLVEAHKRGEIVHVKSVDELPETALRDFISSLGIKSLLTIPLITNAGEYIGFVGFDSVREEHGYGHTEQQLMQVYAQMLVNVMERKQTEAALWKSEEKHRRLFETMPLGVIYQSADSQIVSANPAAERILGLSGRQMPGKTSLDPHWDMILEDGTKVPGSKHPAMQALHSGEKIGPVVRGVYQPDQKKHIWLSITAVPLFQRGETTPYQTYAIIEDITAKRETEKNYKTLFREMVDGFALHEVVFDADGHPADYRFLTVNPAFEKLTGLKASQVIGRTAREVLPEEDLYRLDTFCKVAVDGQPVSFEEYAESIDKHLEIRFFQPELYRFACIMTDISDRNQAEKLIRQNLKEKDVLLAEIHHRVKNNLAVISSLLKLDAEKHADTTSGELLLKAENRIRSMALIHEKLYKTDSFSDISFDEYVKDLSSHIQGHYATLEDKICLRYEISPVTLDITKAIPCGIILNELVTNGFKHAFPGKRRGTIKLSLERMNGEVTLIYQDDGVGLDDEQMERMMSGSEDSLGLTLIQGLVRQIKGRVTMKGENGTRAEIHFSPNA